jgi:hypothetical protein
MEAQPNGALPRDQCRGEANGIGLRRSFAAGQGMAAARSSTAGGAEAAEAPIKHHAGINFAKAHRQVLHLIAAMRPRFHQACE